MTKENILLKIEDLNISFSKGNNKVLRDFSLDLSEREKFALIGESGSGKSVLILAILKLLSNSQIEGKIYYKNKNLLDLKEKEMEAIRGAEISYVPQGGGNALNPLMKVGLQVGEPLVIHKNMSKKESVRQAIDLLKKFNIGDEEKRVNDYPYAFSGGMRQRAMIAMGIAGGAEIILADEPTKGLDSKRIALVEKSFLALEDRAYIVITHDLRFARNISEKVGVLYASYLLEEGQTEDVFQNPLHPYTQAMIAALPENGLKIDGSFVEKPSYDEGCIYRTSCKYACDKCLEAPPMFDLENRKVRCWKYA